MTNFERIKGYYQYFNEDQRLFIDNSGKLEYEMTMKKLREYLPSCATILDLGGATGVYAFPLAEQGYRVHLADLSEHLIQLAKNKKQKAGSSNLISCDVVNAIDLSLYCDEQFDVVLLFGPLYHLLAESERNQCIREVHRVLKPGGMVFASFIPYLSGAIAIVDRHFLAPDQVDANNLREVFSSGRFNNNAHRGFQEGYYPTSDEIVKLFERYSFTMLDLSSIRGFLYEKEDRLYQIKDTSMFDEMIRLAQATANQKEIIETCGHALYIGRKQDVEHI